MIEPAEVADELVDAASTQTAITSLAPLEKIAAGLALLTAEKREFDVTTTAGDKAAREFRRKCVKLRTSMEAAYETVNRPMLEAQAQARKLLKEITASVKALEDPVHADIVAEETRKSAEKARKEQAERERIAAHQAAIEEIHMAAHEGVGKSSEAIRALIVRIEGVETATNFEELRPIAERAKSATLDKLEAQEVAALEQEATAARLAAERAELERLRIEAEAREKAERERIAAEHKAEAARLAAERVEFDRQQAAARAEQEAIATAALAARRAADAQAAAERADADRQAKAIRDAEELRQREERATQQAWLDEHAAALRQQRHEADRIAREARLAQEQKEAAERAIAVAAAREKADAERVEKQAAEDAERERLRAADEADRRGRDAWCALAAVCEALLNAHLHLPTMRTAAADALKLAGRL